MQWEVHVYWDIIFELFVFVMVVLAESGECVRNVVDAPEGILDFVSEEHQPNGPSNGAPLRFVEFEPVTKRIVVPANYEPPHFQIEAQCEDFPEQCVTIMCD